MANFFIIRNKEKNMYYWGDGSWTKSKDCAKKYQHKDCAEILMQIDRLDYKICEVIEIPSIADLEAKLAESESKVAVGRFWHSAYEGKQLDYDKLNDDYNKQEKLLSKVLADKSNLQFDYDQLKQQLAEKEKEETKRMEDFEKGCQEYYKSNQTAIEELEKVKDFARKRIEQLNGMEEKTISVIATGLACVWFIDQIDQQIKSIKG